MLWKYCRSTNCLAVHQPETRDYPWDIYALKELVNATNNFHNDNKIGEGGFGSIYWGRTKKGIAVKRLKALTAKAEMEFAVEVEMLGRVRHKNLLSLRGFYAGGDERLIVYDFMENHSLLTHLHGRLAVSGKRPIEKLPTGAKRDIVRWATPYVENEAFEHIVDPRLNGKYDRAQLESIITIALKCTDSNAESRPSMSQVVEWLRDLPGWRKKEVEPAVEDEGDDFSENSAGRVVPKRAKKNGR
ncbi:hypothetical protein Vadar_021238 [Vaccinium darrowii]|uniref:Uncharacterized protein n=1 Tax=Vaccinium darrowii TaxID=229202 RepID=A0ACB7XJ57_9ERIC|nr:hypothetical protein Vadar_021238 [Vaccinium darrowii]